MRLLRGIWVSIPYAGIKPSSSGGISWLPCQRIGTQRGCLVRISFVDKEMFRVDWSMHH